MLAPVLFFLYVNDLPEMVQSSVKIFEDDTSHSSRSQEERDLLQKDLNNLCS